jgi:hypothetical protein
MVALQTRLGHQLGHYGPAYFPEMNMFVRILEKLGYEKPFTIDQYTPKWVDLFRYLTSRATAEEKQEFIKRAEALPSFSNSRL